MATPGPKAAARRRKPARARRTAPRRAASRPDYGLPIDGFFARQPAHLRAILEALEAGRGGRHLELASLDERPRAAVRFWLRTAAGLARKKG
jgi:hypothetical protein